MLLMLSLLPSLFVFSLRLPQVEFLSKNIPEESDFPEEDGPRFRTSLFDETLKPELDADTSINYPITTDFINSEITGEPASEKKFEDIEVRTQIAEAEIADTNSESDQEDLELDLKLLGYLLDKMREEDIVKYQDQYLGLDDVKDLQAKTEKQLQDLKEKNSLAQTVKDAEIELEDSQDLIKSSVDLRENIESLEEILEEIGENNVEIFGKAYDKNGIEEWIEMLEKEANDFEKAEENERLANAVQEELNDHGEINNLSEDIREDIEILEEALKDLEEGDTILINSQEMDSEDINLLIEDLLSELEEQLENEELLNLSNIAERNINKKRKNGEDDDIKSIEDLINEMDRGDIVYIDGIAYDIEGLEGLITELEGFNRETTSSHGNQGERNFNLYSDTDIDSPVITNANNPSFQATNQDLQGFDGQWPQGYNQELANQNHFNDEENYYDESGRNDQFYNNLEPNGFLQNDYDKSQANAQELQEKLFTGLFDGNNQRVNQQENITFSDQVLENENGKLWPSDSENVIVGL